MDIPLFESDRVPKPRADVHIETVEVIPYPDRTRIYIHVVVTPFMERPNLLLIAHDEQDVTVAELNIIETMHHDMEFTMHLRRGDATDTAGVYTLTAELFYETRKPPHDRRIETFVVPDGSESDEAERH